jgi:lipoprotein-releasing system ATP-binding protein
LSDAPSTVSTAPLVEVQGLTKTFLHEGKEVPILKGIDLRIDRGEVLSVMGASGAGKSTLLHLLGTLDLPTSGRILFEGEDITRYPSKKLAAFRNEKLGFVFQFHHLLPEFTALENVMMPGLIRGAPRISMDEKARAILAEVGLSHRLTHRPGELSGGEQQRVALARALVLSPKLVLADEPTGNLDSATSQQMHELVFALNRRLGTTFLIVTHSNDLAALMPRVVRMRDGTVESDERKATVSGSIPTSDATPSAEDAAPESSAADAV